MRYTTWISSLSLVWLTGVESQKRVINGWNAKPFSLPYIISASTKGDGHFCGGSLLDRKTVLTAAHCSSGKPEQIKVSVHRHNLNKTDEVEQGFSTVLTKMINHPKYDENTLANDVAVWILKTPIPKNIKVQFVTLAENEEDEDVDLPNLTAAGWGLSDYKNGVMPPILQTATLKAISREECAKGWEGEQVDLSNSLCTVSVNKKQSICNGDSGGPLAYKEGEKYIQVGLVSFGELECRIQLKKPDGFIRVASYKKWIQTQQKQHRKSYLVGYASRFVKNQKQGKFLNDDSDELVTQPNHQKSNRKELVLHHDQDHLTSAHPVQKAAKKELVLHHDQDHLTTAHPVKKSVQKAARKELVLHHDQDHLATAHPVKKSVKKAAKKESLLHHDQDELTTAHPSKKSVKKAAKKESLLHHDQDELTTAHPIKKSVKKAAKKESLLHHDQDELTTAHPSKKSVKKAAKKESLLHHDQDELTTAHPSKKSVKKAGDLNPNQDELTSSEFKMQFSIVNYISKLSKRISKLLNKGQPLSFNQDASISKLDGTVGIKNDMKKENKKESSDFIVENFGYMDTEKDFTNPKKTLRSLTQLFYQGIY